MHYHGKTDRGRSRLTNVRHRVIVILIFVRHCVFQTNSEQIFLRNRFVGNWNFGRIRPYPSRCNRLQTAARPPLCCFVTRGLAANMMLLSSKCYGALGTVEPTQRAAVIRCYSPRIVYLTFIIQHTFCYFETWPCCLCGEFLFRNDLIPSIAACTLYVQDYFWNIFPRSRFQIHAAHS